MKFNFSSNFCSWAGWFEYDLVGNPQDRFSRDEVKVMHKSLLYIGVFESLCLAVYSLACFIIKVQLFYW